MRLSRSASVAKQRKDRILGNSRARKKHKRLDAICEKAYNQNHGRVGGSNSSEFNVGVGEEGGESELRRSSRVRRAPVLLDSSPPPPRKRRRVEKRSGGGFNAKSRRDDGGNSESPCSTSKSFGEDSCGWRSRLRSGGKHVSFGVLQKNNYTAKGKRKLFADLDVNEDHKFKAEELDGKQMLESGKSTIVKSKRPGRVKASHVSGNENQEIELDGNEQTNKCNELKTVEQKDEDCSLMENQMESENDGRVKDDAVAPESVEKTENEAVNYLELEECTGNDNTNYVDQENQMQQPGCVEEQVNQNEFVDAAKFSTDQTEDEASHDRALEDKGSKNVVQMTTISNDLRDKPRIKEGRRCGLCGGGTDGKPPKKLVHDGTGSDNEAYSGSSAADEPNYDIWDGFGDEPGWLGRLLGPINDRFGIARIWVHQNCAVWSPEVYFAGLGCLKNIRAALCRGRVLKCSRCGRQGATIGCRVDRCPKTYHLPCARANGCIFDHRKFLIACTHHRNFFQPHGSQLLRQLKKMKAKKLKMEMRKLTNDAWRRDLEAEEKWLENCGEDEEFLKRESKRLHRDLLRTAPVYIGGSNAESGIQFQGWESVAGLQDVIQCLKEVVILPLLYPELFCNLGLTPPRGVLLHGYPGTGKTLVVRALIGSCARGDKQIAYFARKGADCLGKYVGDAERQLRLLFQVAEKSQPSIIFFDEIDGLAPSRTRRQDQTHNSVVSTLLALLDGLKSRGSVVVIGATNRPDAVDPALRRPGRFDREIYFPLPSVKDREAILSLHTQKWPNPVTGPLLKWVARKTVGFAGADLQALCTQAAIIALKRSCPWQEILSVAGKKVPQGKHPLLPTFTVEERDWLEALSCGPPPCSRREAGMAANDVIASPLEVHLIPCLLQPLSRLLVSLYLDERLWLPPPIFKAATLIKRVIVSALDEKNLQTDCWWSHVHDLLQEADVATQIENNLACAGIVVGDANFAHLECLDDSSDNVRLDFEPYKMPRRVASSSLLPNMSFASGKRTGFRILISGSLRSGQKHLASCLLHCFVGNIEIHKVDLATILQEGHGDVVQGLTQILLRCSSVGSCMIFLPRIDLWAIEKFNDNCRGESVSPVENHESSVEKRSCLTDSEVDGDLVCKSTEEIESQVVALRASFIWKSFIEQVESINVSTSLMILATSEVPFPILPARIKQFFKNDTLNCSPLTPQEDTVPRFSLHVEGNFNHDLAINSSASKLCKDVGQLFVQLIHHRNHTNLNVQKQYHSRGTIEGDAGANCLNLDPVSTIEPGSNLMSPTIPIVKYPLPVDNKTVKVKSNLLAISTFGYQILWYPHFAELCWVTSKLKEGPFADVIGPWKGWPFNSCIVRPSSASGRVAVVCSSSNVRPKEKSSLVRGLIAVGLSAYRGLYTSLREVCSDVKKVLELLTRRIDTKIQAGKDRYQFMRVSSQVTHLEDLVSSWAYSLQSLEVDAQLAGKDSELSAMESLDECKNYQNNSIESDDKLNVPSKCVLGSEVLEERAQVVGTRNVDPVDLTGGECGPPNGNNGEAMNPMTLHDFASGLQLRSSKFSDPFGIKPLKGQNGFTSEPHQLEDSGRDAEFGKDVNILQQSNGVVHVDSVVLPEDGPCSPSDLGGVKLSRAGKQCNQDTISSPAGINIPTEDGQSNVDGHNGNASCSNISAGLPHNSGVTCLYNCCSKCLFNLHNVIFKILNDEWGVKRNDWTVEDVNDVVASLSVDLHSTVRKYWMVGSSSDSFDRIQNNCRELNGQEMGCRCENSGSGLVMPMECSCHAMHESRTAKAIFSDNLEQGLSLRLIFRDGVLAAIDPGKDVSFHCKFRTLCLCSLIEWIVMAKQPLD